MALPSEVCQTVKCDLQWIIFSTEVGERRLHSNPVGTPNLVWIGWKLQKFSLQNFRLIHLSPWVPTFHPQQGGSHVAPRCSLQRALLSQGKEPSDNKETSLGHCLVNDCNVMCILRNMIHVPSWYPSIHYDAIKWKYFPCYSPFVWGTTDHSGFSSQRDNNADLWYFFVGNLNRLLNKHSIGR